VGIRLQPPTALHSGFVVFEAPGAADRMAAAAELKDRTIHFNGRQQKHFEVIAQRVQEQIDVARGTVAAPSPERIDSVVEAQVIGSPAATYVPEASTAVVDAAVNETELDDQVEAAVDLAEQNGGRGTEWETMPAGTEKTELRAEPRVMISRLVTAGSTLRGAGLQGEPLPDVDRVLSVTGDELESLTRWLAEIPREFFVPDGSYEHPGADYLARSVRFLADRAATSLDDARRARSGGRGLFGRGVGDPWTPLLDAISVELSAVAVLSVLCGYIEPDDSSYRWVREAPMYEVLTAGLASVSRQLYNVAQDPRSSQPAAVEPFFGSVTESLQTMKRIIEDRRADLSELGTPQQQAGTAYILACATDTWQTAVDSLGDGRQLFLGTRDRWAGSASMVLESIGITMLHLLSGQALLSVSDAYAHMELPGGVGDDLLVPG
jgi:hypothetical protein